MQPKVLKYILDIQSVIEAILKKKRCVSIKSGLLRNIAKLQFCKD
jgi:hypothetical protein